MQQCNTGAPAPQPPPFPRVSYRLLVRFYARRDAQRHGVHAQPVVDAVDAAYRATRGDRFAARRAAWAAVDHQCARTAKKLKGPGPLSTGEALAASIHRADDGGRTVPRLLLAQRVLEGEV